MYRRKLAFSIEAAIVALACVTLGLAIKYAIQLWNAPVYGGDVNNTRPSRTTIIPEYSILPVITIVAGLFNMALHVASGVRALYAVIVSSLLATAWLVMIAIWGQCHLQAHDNPDNPWYEVCYQTNIKADYKQDYIEGVSKALGAAVVAFGALIFIA
ncbi:hypothetical protein BU26DRAFT_600049 [Trematosphaeria pertusa]|uniref:MARVEL domain-containing protein n=1 Tax=Trematosphaeria pertusa TaxID=390896 RepID=A0A6A6IW59_9PLEO|nr:uncharacterized protein BU26DRAFT_600049 [Trematosphaeria pertusa]KAF2254307.1 hypothetical protein BU26DRAFT_600049 [Trematosphaeria pertusa]